jgi:3-dehydroquinate synthase
MPYNLTFPSGTVQYYFNSQFQELDEVLRDKTPIIITDKNVQKLHAPLMEGFPIISLPPGEKTKSIETVAFVGERLIKMEATRKTILVGVGGGVITDLTGFIASVYLRGVDFGFVPTTLLGMVDASIGGKNGVNLGMYKNMLGTIRQPSFILHDAKFLDTLPEQEWSNGFAEAIKYACVFESSLFEKLLSHDIQDFKNSPAALQSMIQRCAEWKNKTVLDDEQEQGSRKLLNFGHTAGHAIETTQDIPHGFAVSIGMIISCCVSERLLGLPSEVRNLLTSLLEQYSLPTSIEFNPDQVMNILKMDKKRTEEGLDLILLEKIGKGIIRSVPFQFIYEALVSFSNETRH